MLKTIQYMLLGICCASFGAVPLFAADSNREVVLAKLNTAVKSKSIDPSRLNVLAEQCVQMKLDAAAPLLTKVLDQKLKRSASANGTTAYHLARVVEAICALGGRDDYRAMVSLFAAAPPNSEFRRASANSLLRYGCKHEIAAALARPNKRQPAFPKLEEALPEHLQGAPAELQDAWRYYRRATAPFRGMSMDDDSASVSVEMNWTHFYSTIEDSLVGEKEDNLSCVASFQWGSWCGTGSEMLYAPKSRAIVLELVRDGRLAESVGAALELSSSRMMGASTNGSHVEFHWKRQLIESCGLDWERLFLGKIVSGESGDELQAMGAYGGEATAKKLLVLVNLRPRNNHSLESQLQTLAMMVDAVAAPPTETIFVYGGDRKTRSPDAPKISAQSQTAILKVLHSHVNEAGDPHFMKQVVAELVRLRRPESVPTLRKVAAMDYYEVAKSAAVALRSMGEDIALPKPPADGRFRVQVNDGALVKGTQVKYSTTAGDNLSTMSSGGGTDLNGEIRIDGSWFADPRVNASVLEFSSSGFSSLNQVIFASKVAVPADRTAVIAVSISAHPLRLVLNDSPLGENAKVSLEYRGPVKPEPRTSFYMSMGGQISVPIRDSLNFPQLGEGRYIISLDVPGRALWRSEEIVMDKQRELVVDLRPGAALRFELVAPGGKKADQQVQYKLLGLPAKDYHRHTDYPTKGFRGLPIGEYTLKILSSAEKRASQQRLGSGENSKTHACLPGDYHGREIKIEITEDKPQVNLGTIRLKPVAK